MTFTTYGLGQAGVRWLPAPSPRPLQRRRAGKLDFIYFHTRGGWRGGTGQEGREGCWEPGLLVSGRPGLALMTEERRRSQWAGWGAAGPGAALATPLAVDPAPSPLFLPGELHRWDLGNVPYKSLSLRDSAFFFMNHAGSASGLSVCRTTNQEKFDLTRQGTFHPSQEENVGAAGRHRAGDRPRGCRGQQGASLGPTRLGAGKCDATETPAEVRGAGAWGGCRSLASLLGSPPSGPPVARQESCPPLRLCIFALCICCSMASNNGAPFQNLTHGRAHSAFPSPCCWS